MANLTGSQGLPTNESAEQTQENSANFIIGIVLLVSAFVGCSLAVLALGRDFFIGKNPPVVFVGALVWVDFIGLFSTVVLVFQGFVKGEEWIAKPPQCSLQAFFTTTFGLSSGAVVTFMSLDRVVSLYKPFFYRQHATPCLTRTLCIILTLFCMTLAALPFAGIGKYKYNQSSRSFCNFDWFPTTLADTVYIFAIAACGVLLISLMTLSNIVVFIIVVRIRMRMAAVLPSEINARRRARRVTFCQEERMAKFVALVSIVFLITWLPVTVRLFCNVFRAYPSNWLDNFSLRLIIVSFFLDPFTYVLFKKNFKRNLKRSITDLAEFLSDVGFNKNLKRQITRGNSEGGSEMPGNMSEFGLGKTGEATVIEPDRQSHTLKIETPVDKATS